MKIATIYTLYNRRAGAELCFEKTIEAVYRYNNQTEWTVFCNKQAEEVLHQNSPYVKAIYIPFLDNQYKKAFWLEFMSQKFVNKASFDCFWIPSGCNHFPGHWDLPVLTTFHDLGEYHIKNKYGFARTIFRKQICIPRAVKRSTSFTAVSRFTAKDLHHFLHLPQENIQVIYNGNSPHDHQSSSIPCDDSIFEMHHIIKSNYFFTPGRTDFIGKGLDILIESFKKISNENPELKLVLVGPQGEGHNELVKIIESLQSVMSDKILYLGRVSDNMLNALYANCKATIIASRFEGFGFPVLEAMRHQVPIISSDAGSLPEVAHDAAIFFKSGDCTDLTTAIKELLAMPEEALKILLQEGKNRLNAFSWDNCGKEMHDAFVKVCQH